VTGFNPQRFAPFAHKVMVEIDPPELAKMGDSVRTKICADAGEASPTAIMSAARRWRIDGYTSGSEP